MGGKTKYVILILILLPNLILSQVKDFVYIDSVTYKYYLEGSWDNLIREGEAAIKSGTDYKYIRQRLGYAYFSKGDYLSSRKHLKKALGYDSYDQFSLFYLYRANMNSGMEEYSGKIEKSLLPASGKEMGVQSYVPVESIDLEFNHKFTNSGFRSGAWYYRAGLGTKLGSRLRLYQSFSGYSQTVTENFTPAAGKFNIRQPEYYASLDLNASEGILITAAYHHLNTLSGSNQLKGNLFFLGFAPDLNRFNLQLNGSVLDYLPVKIWQAEVHSGYTFPGSSSFYMKASLAWLSYEKNAVITPRAGLRLGKVAWIEGFASLGRMQYYNDYNGLYIYNSYDPLVMRTGAGIMYFINEKVSFWLNFSYEKKEYYNYSANYFNQFSYLGGIKWKI